MCQHRALCQQGLAVRDEPFVPVDHARGFLRRADLSKDGAGCGHAKRVAVYVPTCRTWPVAIASIHSLDPPNAASGTPPPIDFPIVIRSAPHRGDGRRHASSP